MAQCAFCQIKIAHCAIIFYMIDIKEIQKRLREAIEYSNISQNLS